MGLEGGAERAAGGRVEVEEEPVEDAARGGLVDERPLGGEGADGAGHGRVEPVVVEPQAHPLAEGEGRRDGRAIERVPGTPGSRQISYSGRSKKIPCQAGMPQWFASASRWSAAVAPV